MDSLTESCLLAALGGIVSIIVAKWTLDLVASLVPAEAQTTMQFAVDPRLVVCAAILTLATGILFSLFPALHSTRPDVLTALKGQTGQPAGARSAARFRNALATFQVALSMALLVSSGLFVKSLFNISRVDLGIKTDELITFQVAPSLRLSLRAIAPTISAVRGRDRSTTWCRECFGVYRPIAGGKQFRK